MNHTNVESLSQCHLRLEDARIALARLNDELTADPDNAILATACTMARRQYLDASTALLAAIDPPAPAPVMMPFRFTTGAIARQMHGSSAATGQAVTRMSRERVVRRDAHRRSRA